MVQKLLRLSFGKYLLIKIFYKMKKFFVIIFVLFAYSMFYTVNAQFHIGLRGGLNIANMSVKNIPIATDNKSIPSFYLGSFAEFNLTKKVSIETGLYLSGKGINSEFNQSLGFFSVSGSAKITPLYLEVPLNGVYNFDFKLIKLRFFAGPYAAYGIGGKVNSDFSASGLPIDLSSLGLQNETRNLVFGSDTTSDIRPFDFGLNVGVGAQFRKFDFSIQYGLGLPNVAADNTTGYESRNRVVRFTVGYRIF